MKGATFSLEEVRNVDWYGNSTFPPNEPRCGFMNNREQCIRKGKMFSVCGYSDVGGYSGAFWKYSSYKWKSKPNLRGLVLLQSFRGSLSWNWRCLERSWLPSPVIFMCSDLMYRRRLSWGRPFLTISQTSDLKVVESRLMFCFRGLFRYLWCSGRSSWLYCSTCCNCHNLRQVLRKASFWSPNYDTCLTHRFHAAQVALQETWWILDQHQLVYDQPDKQSSSSADPWKVVIRVSILDFVFHSIHQPGRFGINGWSTFQKLEIGRKSFLVQQEIRTGKATVNNKVVWVDLCTVVGSPKKKTLENTGAGKPTRQLMNIIQQVGEWTKPNKWWRSPAFQSFWEWLQKTSQYA